MLATSAPTPRRSSPAAVPASLGWLLKLLTNFWDYHWHGGRTDRCRNLILILIASDQVTLHWTSMEPWSVQWRVCEQWWRWGWWKMLPFHFLSAVLRLFGYRPTIGPDTGRYSRPAHTHTQTFSTCSRWSRFYLNVLYNLLNTTHTEGFCVLGGLYLVSF